MSRAGLDRRQLLRGAAAAAGGLVLGCQPARVGKGRTVRAVTQVVAASASRDGAGVALRRCLGGRALPMVDPFLLLDEIHSADPADYQAGFPTHPHRGFETVSYLLRGGFRHRDSVGNSGFIVDGGAQWMTAGRGILHEEMPAPGPGGGTEVWGLQLWVNLPAARKWDRPRYQDLGASAVPELDVDGARVRLVAGALGGQRGPVDGIATGPTLLDATVPAGATLRHDLPGTDSALVYVLEGALALGAEARLVAAGSLAVFGPGQVAVLGGGPAGGRALLIAGAPIGEPVARRGPFVMNTAAELEQAFADYRSGRLAGG